MNYIGKVLVACEESQEITKTLRNIGIEAYSCDIEPQGGASRMAHNARRTSFVKWELCI